MRHFPRFFFQVFFSITGNHRFSNLYETHTFFSAMWNPNPNFMYFCNVQKPEKKYQPLRGKIIHGDALGRTLGFPTANLQTTDLLPDNGVYIAQLEWNTKLYQGILNIGFRPTVQGCEQRVEATYIKSICIE